MLRNSSWSGEDAGTRGHHVWDREAVLSLEDVSKEFPGVKALDKVRFSLRRGEVHAVCGENGAGKSTLMRIISGLYKPDSGRIVYKGQEVCFASPQDAERAGIAMIHQELNLVPHLNVAENIYLAREPRRGPFVDRKRLRKEAQRCLDRLGVDISPDAPVGGLPVAQRQMVEIAKALSIEAEVLIMDEPTSSLTESETALLFKVIRELKAAGVAIVYISHRLHEMVGIADRVTVLRDGRYVSTDYFDAVTVDGIVTRMVGRSLDEKFPPRTSVPRDEVLFEVRNLNRGGIFSGISFTLRRGEILGFAGLIGSGRTEVARAIFGADALDSGTLLSEGRPIKVKSPREAIRQGLAYLSEDRKLNGLAVKMPVAANVTLANMEGVSDKAGFINFRKEASVAGKYVELLNIRTPSIHQIAQLLSGGNQQKIVIAKWLFRGSRILFFDEPTRGIDVGAKFAIHKMMDELAASGFGVILISSDLPEVMGMSDRIAVFHEGRITGIVDAGKTSQEEIIHYASGYAPGARH
jgi:ribose transport system ATP-binding protein